MSAASWPETKPEGALPVLESNSPRAGVLSTPGLRPGYNEPARSPGWPLYVDVVVALVTPSRSAVSDVMHVSCVHRSSRRTAWLAKRGVCALRIRTGIRSDAGMQLAATTARLMIKGVITHHQLDLFIDHLYIPIKKRESITK